MKVQDIEELSSVTVRIGGRPFEGGWDRVARYCGLPWSGGDDETWAFRYYDAVPSPRSDIVRPLDVLATGALHPGLTKSELTFFNDERDAITAWLEVLPEDQHLAGCEGDVLRHLAELATWDTPVSLQLLTKVLHRKRPKLIPLVDRHVVDWYRPVTGERSATAAWPALLGAIREDLDLPNVIFLHAMAAAVEEATFERLSTLRVIDIIIWMGYRP